MGKIMLKTTEPVAILSMREIENLINAAVKKAVEETMQAIGCRTATRSNERHIHQRPNIEGSILRIGQVKDLVGLSSASIYRRIKAGEFPAPVKLGKHASGWLLSDINAWVSRLVV